MTSPVCDDCIFVPSGRVTFKGVIAGVEFCTCAFTIKKWLLAPESRIAWLSFEVASIVELANWVGVRVVV